MWTSFRQSAYAPLVIRFVFVLRHSACACWEGCLGMTHEQSILQVPNQASSSFRRESCSSRRFLAAYFAPSSLAIASQ